jgi:hypothetical protein
MKIHQVLLASAASALGAVPAWAANPTATASYSDTLLSPGEYQYNITLNNIGAVPIGVYWFSWVPGAGFLSEKPTNVMSPSGWTDNLTNNGAAIMWMSSSPLASGGKLTGFSFDSTETPAQLAGTLMPASSAANECGTVLSSCGFSRASVRSSNADDARIDPHRRAGRDSIVVSHK